MTLPNPLEATHLYCLLGMGFKVLSGFQKGPFLARERTTFPFGQGSSPGSMQIDFLVNMVIFTERGRVASWPLAVKSNVLPSKLGKETQGPDRGFNGFSEDLS